jgi:hypothetical protein
MRGISTQTLEQSLNVYYQRLTNWNTTEEKRQQYLKRIDEITEELNKEGECINGIYTLLGYKSST